MSRSKPTLRRFALPAIALLLCGCSTEPAAPATGRGAAAGTTQRRQPVARERATDLRTLTPVQETEAERLSKWVALVGTDYRFAPDIPMGDDATVARIINEGQNRNQVMQHLRVLTEELGPRLTGSSRLEAANRWALEQFRSWGLTNARLEQWGELPVRFDRGPSTGFALVANGSSGATRRDFELTTLSWTAGTEGPVRGPVFAMPASEEEYTRVRSQLSGAWVLIAPDDGDTFNRGGPGTRYAQRADARARVEAGDNPAELPIDQRVMFDGVAGFISASRDERVWTGTFSRRGAGSFRDLDFDDLPPDVEVIVRRSDFEFMRDALAEGHSVVAEFDLDNTFVRGPIPLYNTIAEIRGTTLPDEVIILSAHLDSWDGPGSQGTTDNGTGSSVMLEAARILMAAGAKPKRTIRFILWTGEEQGLLGSAAYVDAIKDQWPRISACFVDDGGTNYQGGVPVTDAMVPYFARATAPVNHAFPDMPVRVRPVGASLPRGGGSDHASFNAVGIPGFFWDEIGRADYGYGWHTQHDRYDLAIPEYLIQSSTCSAVTAYNLACAPTLLPRAEPPSDDAPRQGRPRERGAPR